MTYIVAENPEILSQLLRETEMRGLNPAAYSTPASAFNTISVDYAGQRTHNTLGCSPRRKAKKTKEHFFSSQNDSCMGTLSTTSSSSDVLNMSPSGSKPTSNYGTLDIKVSL